MKLVSVPYSFIEYNQINFYELKKTRRFAPFYKKNRKSDMKKNGVQRETK